MNAVQVWQVAYQVLWVVFAFALGGCVGSLINVLGYRMPRGLSVVFPPSACPKCGTKLSWRDNIPILGWLMLRGRCRYCRQKISPEYPIVEAVMACLFALLVYFFMLINPNSSWLGIPWGQIRPEWAREPALTWPVMAIILVLVGSLAAMTVVDLKTFTIPLELAWIPAVVGVVGHTSAAAWYQARTGLDQLRIRSHMTDWALPTPLSFDAFGDPYFNWWLAGAAIGGVVGLGAALLLLKFGLIRRSFEDYEQWEKGALEEQAREGAPAAPAPPADPDAAQDQPRSEDAPGPADWPKDEPIEPAPPPAQPPQADGPGRALDGAPFESTGDAPPEAAPEAPHETHQTPHETPHEGRDPAGTPDLWIQYPHARREMFKEIVYLAPAILLALAFGALAVRFGPGLWDAPPLWFKALTGSLLGYLIGGGVVWAIRIFGSLAFGKEAMGLGDVHLMAAVGACLGWIDPTLAFFLSAFVGVLWTLVGLAKAGGFKRAIPYGPYLSIATVLVLFCKPLIELGLSRLLGAPINLP